MTLSTQDTLLAHPSIPPTVLCYRLGPEVVIGRSPGCEVNLVDFTVSRHHARIYTDHSEAWAVEDAGSSNGTFLNGKRLEGGVRTCFGIGDFLRFGNVTLLAMEGPGHEEPPRVRKGQTSPLEIDAITSGSGLGPTSDVASLTNAQIRVLQLILRGLRRETIADQLHLSPETVKSHASKIYRHFGVGSKTELLAQILSDVLEPENFRLRSTLRA